MVYGVCNDKTACNEIDQHNKSSEYQAYVGISDFEIGYLWMFIICHAHMVINSSAPNKP
jgi:hypothetical protein